MLAQQAMRGADVVAVSVRRALMYGHQVGRTDAPIRRREGRLEHVCRPEIAPLYRERTRRRGTQIAAPVSVQQPAEDCRRVEAARAEPVHRTVACDQRCRVAVAEDGIVTDGRIRAAAVCSYCPFLECRRLMSASSLAAGERTDDDARCIRNGRRQPARVHGEAKLPAAVLSAVIESTMGSLVARRLACTGPPPIRVRRSVIQLSVPRQPCCQVVEDAWDDPLPQMARSVGQPTKTSRCR